MPLVGMVGGIYLKEGEKEEDGEIWCISLSSPLLFISPVRNGRPKARFSVLLAR